MTTITLLIVIASMLTGVACTLAALLLIERRVMARPGARVAVARNVLAVSDPWGDWCAANPLPYNPSRDDPRLDIMPWGGGNEAEFQAARRMNLRAGAAPVPMPVPAPVTRPGRNNGVVEKWVLP